MSQVRGISLAQVEPMAAVKGKKPANNLLSSLLTDLTKVGLECICTGVIV